MTKYTIKEDCRILGLLLRKGEEVTIDNEMYKTTDGIPVCLVRDDRFSCSIESSKDSDKNDSVDLREINDLYSKYNEAIIHARSGKYGITILKTGESFIYGENPFTDNLIIAQLFVEMNGTKDYYGHDCLNYRLKIVSDGYKYLKAKRQDSNSVSRKEA